MDKGKRIVYVSCDVTTVAPSYTPLPKKRGTLRDASHHFAKGSASGVTLVNSIFSENDVFERQWFRRGDTCRGSVRRCHRMSLRTARERDTDVCSSCGFVVNGDCHQVSVRQRVYHAACFKCAR
ncbi:hypothetical protein NP493_84g01008 [Ridgeia piscesae]|uniref:LIM zinc-binding domain-containing protein n=1 Tax=Ridgeia piscesae TaxID=27915 RepID=A0AAD9P8U0_RIDPI|nr:hypothetical protein NP493_84g01008 [Ridgeia piscesae]